jgi:hypothetical protein
MLIPDNKCFKLGWSKSECNAVIENPMWLWLLETTSAWFLLPLQDALHVGEVNLYSTHILKSWQDFTYDSKAGEETVRIRNLEIQMLTKRTQDPLRTIAGSAVTLVIHIDAVLHLWHDRIWGVIEPLIDTTDFFSFLEDVTLRVNVSTWISIPGCTANLWHDLRPRTLHTSRTVEETDDGSAKA